jgi:hypothetical protein
MGKFWFCAGVASIALAALGLAGAQTARSTGIQPAPGPEIIVTAPFRQSEEDVLAGTSVVSGEELTRDLRSSLGETLTRQAGVSATSFGPNASRPILRGFQGERVRVLTDGIGAIDVSNTSADHAVVIDPLLAERIEVLRGPSALLFGSSAIGGVVNVLDSRIPRSVPADGYRFNGIATYGSAANERSIGGAGDVAVSQHFVLHADGSYLKSSDLHIGGHVLTPAARAQALAAASGPALPDDPDFALTAALKDKLPNSAAETWTAGVGAAFISDSASIGLSYSHYDSLYGVPIRYALASGEEQEAPRLSVLQNRFDLRGEIATGGGLLEKVRVRAAYAKYRHFELEEDGGVGTAFYNKGFEGRLELVQVDRGGWRGASGVQYFHRNFDVAVTRPSCPATAPASSASSRSSSSTSASCAPRAAFATNTARSRPRPTRPTYVSSVGNAGSMPYRARPGYPMPWRTTCGSASIFPGRHGRPRPTSSSPMARMPEPRHGNWATPISGWKKAGASRRHSTSTSQA